MLSEETAPATALELLGAECCNSAENTVVPDHFCVLYSVCFLKALRFPVNNPGQVKYGRNTGCDP